VGVSFLSAMAVEPGYSFQQPSRAAQTPEHRRGAAASISISSQADELLDETLSEKSGGGQPVINVRQNENDNDAPQRSRIRRENKREKKAQAVESLSSAGAVHVPRTATVSSLSEKHQSSAKSTAGAQQHSQAGTATGVQVQQTKVTSAKCIDILKDDVSDRVIKVLVVASDVLAAGEEEKTLIDALVRALIHLPTATRLQNIAPVAMLQVDHQHRRDTTVPGRKTSSGGSSTPTPIPSSLLQLEEKIQLKYDVLSGIATINEQSCDEEAPHSLMGATDVNEVISADDVDSWEESVLTYLQCNRRKVETINNWLRNLQRDVVARVEHLAEQCKTLQLTPSLDEDDGFNAAVAQTQEQVTRVEKEDLVAVHGQLQDIAMAVDWTNTEMSHAYMKLMESKEQNLLQQTEERSWLSTWEQKLLLAGVVGAFLVVAGLIGYRTFHVHKHHVDVHGTHHHDHDAGGAPVAATMGGGGAAPQAQMGAVAAAMGGESYSLLQNGSTGGADAAGAAPSAGVTFAPEGGGGEGRNTDAASADVPASGAVFGPGGATATTPAAPPAPLSPGSDL